LLLTLCVFLVLHLSHDESSVQLQG